MIALKQYFSAVFLIFSLLLCSHGNAGEGEDNSKKVFFINSPTELAKEFENSMHQQIDPSLIKAEALHAGSVKIVPIFWQSYIWKEYDLCEEVILLGTIKTTTGENRSLLIRARRSPYRSGSQCWTVELAPDILYDESERFEWEFVDIDKLKTPGFILQWCNNRNFFERTAKLDTPLIQRWIFNYNWKLALGRDLIEDEIEVVSQVGDPGQIAVPLQKDGKQ